MIRKDWSEMNEEEKAETVKRWKKTGMVSEKDLNDRKDMRKGCAGGRKLKGRMG